MKKKLLKICDPPIKLYLNHSYILSVLLTNEKALSWVYSNYIQITYFKDFIKREKFSVNFFLGNMSKYFYNIPFLDVRTLDKEFFKVHFKNVTKFIINSINSNYYIMTIVDEFYIKEKASYNLEHFMHLIMINGYDLEKKCFYIAGFDINRIYKKQEVSFEEFNKSFFSDQGYNKNIRDNFLMLYKTEDYENIKFPQKNFNVFKYEFDIEHVKLSLMEYLNSKCSSDKLRMYANPIEELGYGIGVYLHLIKYLRYIIDNKKIEIIDFRGFHGLLEHKKLMINRIKYMKNNKYLFQSHSIIEEFQDIAKDVNILRNLIFKFNIKPNHTLLDTCVDIIEKLKTKEHVAISTLIEKIDN